MFSLGHAQFENGSFIPAYVVIKPKNRVKSFGSVLDRTIELFEGELNQIVLESDAFGMLNRARMNRASRE
jgi:hypothetical protein